MDGATTVLARWRLPEGVAGIAQLHQLIGGLLGEDAGNSEVRVGIETDHGPRAMAVIAAGYQVFPVNPQQSAWFRARHQLVRELPADGTALEASWRGGRVGRSADGHAYRQARRCLQVQLGP
jgi:hypothetical protein